VRILIVSWGWPPISRVGCLRPLGMAREWVAAGHEVHVLTGPGDRGGEYTPDLVPEAEATGAIVHRADAPAIPRPAELRPAYAAASSEATRPPISRARQIAGQWKGFPDLQRSWIRPAIARARELDARHRFDVVWSTSPPESVHFVGRALAAAGIPWVADFRDQWSEYMLGRWDPVSRWLIDRITAVVLRPAAAVTANTEGVARQLARAAGREVTCARNGFDGAQPVSSDVVARTLGYFGRMDAIYQHPERLWPAFRTLSLRGRPWRLDFYTTPGGGGGARIIVPPDLQDMVRVLPPVPHSQALTKMATMTALLVLAWETRGGDATVAGKLYEYVGSGRPVLACAPPSFEARRLVESTGTGIGAWADEEIAAALETLETFVVDPSGRSSLSRATFAAQLLDVFHRLPARRTA
jgi:Glycosyl transferase 4-like domain